MTRRCASLAEAAGAAVVLSPGSTGVLPDAHPQNMHVGGSKGSISGNFAMAEAELVIVIGSRAVCQADCSGIGYKSAQPRHQHQRRPRRRHCTTTAPWRSSATSRPWPSASPPASKRPAPPPTRQSGLLPAPPRRPSGPPTRSARFEAAPIRDDGVAAARAGATRGHQDRRRLRQVASARAKFFDAGDVQANGFQIVEDDQTGDTFTETGASYMGFAVSALLASALADKPRYGIAFTGDGSFMMNPQILIDGVEHGVKRHHRHLRQPPHGRDHRPAGGAVRHRLPHQRFRGRSTTCASPAPSAGVNALHGGWTADELQARAAKPRTPTTASRSSTCRSTPATTSSPAWAPGASGTSATGATTCSALGWSRICRSTAPRRLWFTGGEVGIVQRA